MGPGVEFQVKASIPTIILHKRRQAVLACDDSGAQYRFQRSAVFQRGSANAIPPPHLRGRSAGLPQGSERTNHIHLRISYALYRQYVNREETPTTTMLFSPLQLCQFPALLPRSQDAARARAAPMPAK